MLYFCTVVCVLFFVLNELGRLLGWEAPEFNLRQAVFVLSFIGSMFGMSHIALTHRIRELEKKLRGNSDSEPA